MLQRPEVLSTFLLWRDIIGNKILFIGAFGLGNCCGELGCCGDRPNLIKINAIELSDDINPGVYRILVLMPKEFWS